MVKTKSTVGVERSKPPSTSVKAKTQDVNEDNVVDYVRAQRDSGVSFERIATDLEKMGFTSKRTGEPLSYQTVRYYYYYGLRRSGSSANTQNNELTEKLRMIKGIVDMRSNDEMKVNMIKAVLTDFQNID
jgi:hypothetical protein